jgi:hypothetical protein
VQVEQLHLIVGCCCRRRRTGRISVSWRRYSIHHLYNNKIEKKAKSVKDNREKTGRLEEEENCTHEI